MRKIYALLLTFFLPTFVFAIAQSDTKIPDTLAAGPSDIIKLLNTIADWLFTFLLVLAVIFILIAAFNYLTASGSEEKVQKAHKMLIFAVVAIAVGTLASEIMHVVYRSVSGTAAESNVINQELRR